MLSHLQRFINEDLLSASVAYRDKEIGGEEARVNMICKRPSCTHTALQGTMRERAHVPRLALFLLGTQVGCQECLCQEPPKGG